MVRIASRHMPKFTRRPLGRAGTWLLVTVIAAGVTCAIAIAPTTSALALGVLAVTFLLARLEHKRQERALLSLASAREGQSICEFARDFDSRALDTWIIRAVYEQLQGQLRHVYPAFPVRATDRLKEDLLLDEDDVDIDLVEEVEARTGRLIDDCSNNPYFGRVKTVRDFVLFFQCQPKSSSAA